MTDRHPPAGGPPRYRDLHSAGARGRGNGPGAGRREPPRAPSPVVTSLIYGGIVLLGLVVTAVTFLMLSPPTDLIRREMAAEVRAATGRELVMAGPVSLTFFPSPGVRLGEVSLSAPPGMGGEPFLTAASLDVGVRLLPLLGGRVAVDRVVLNRPVLALRVDRDGRRNWDMAAAARPVRLAQAGGATRTDVPTDAAVPAFPGEGASAEVSLDDVRILDGTLRYRNEATGGAFDAEAVNAELALASLAHPLTAKGSLVAAREKVDFDGSLSTPADFLERRSAKLALNVSGRSAKARYDGSVSLGEAFGADGAIEASAASLRELVQWLGAELPPVRGLGQAAVAGRLSVAADAVRLSEARLALDGATATGSIGVATGGARPRVSAELAVTGFDLANYRTAGGAKWPQPVPAPPAPAGAEEAQSIEDLLDRSDVPQAVGADAEAVVPVPFGLVDIDAKLAMANLSLGKVRVEAARLAVGLEDRVLKTAFEEVKLYQGSGTGTITLDATAPDAALSADLKLSGIAARPLLKDVADIDWLAGTADVALTVAGRGASRAAIVQALDGKANVAVKDGAIVGFNLGGAMRALSEGEIPELRGSPSEATDFSELSGSFVIAGGIAKNEDLKLASPLVRATGAGTINLVEESLDYTLRPKLVASLSGQGAADDPGGIEIPVHITGPWDEPKIAPDLEGAINNPDAVEAVKQLGREYKGKSAGEIVEDLFGKKEDGEPSKAERLLQQFLGR